MWVQSQRYCGPHPSPWLIAARPALQSAGLENEIFTSVDPEQAVDLSTLPPQLQAPGPPLSADPTGWLPDAASWRGSAQRVHIAEAAAAGMIAHTTPQSAALRQQPHQLYFHCEFACSPKQPPSSTHLGCSITQSRNCRRMLWNTRACHYRLLSAMRRRQAEPTAAHCAGLH